MIEQARSDKHDLIAWATRELKRLVAIVLYLWVMFGLYVLNEAIIKGEEHINFAAHGFALINAIVLAKVLLIAEDLNFANRFEDSPLVFPILYKSLAFAILFVGAHIGESELIGLLHGRTAIGSFPPIGGGTVKGFLCVVAIMFVSLIPFFAFREIGRVIGADKVWALLFKRRAGPLELRSA
jgi:hypothetical protein